MEILKIIVPIIVTALFTAVATYLGYIHSLKERVTLMESKVELLEKRMDSHSGKIDEILNVVTEIKVELGKVSTALNMKQ